MTGTSDQASDPGGTINSDRVAPGIARDQPVEGARKDAEDASALRMGNDVDEEGAPPDRGSTGAADPGRHVDT